MPVSAPPSTNIELLSAIKKIPVFSDLDDEDLLWFLSLSEEMRFAPGEVMFREGDPADWMLVYLSGRTHSRVEADGATAATYVAKTGDVTGMLPFSRMTHIPVTGRVEEPVHVLRFPASRFPEMLHRIPQLGKRLVGILTDRVRESTRTEQQRDKLAALGKLSAGLAHELNNPAAAAARSSDALIACLAKLRVIDADPVLAEANCTGIAKLEIELRNELCPANFKDQLERSDREDALGTWLQAHNVNEPWKLAPSLADAGMEVSHLERFGAAAGDAVSPALYRFATFLEMERIVSQINHSTKRISTLVKAIKEYSYMDQSPIQEVDIVRGVETTLAIMEHKLRKGISVTKEFASDIPKVSANGGELNQIWTNLIDNAADAMKGKGQLRLKILREDDTILVEIADNGSGIPKDIQSRIFEPFFTTKGVGDGTGLGLDAVQRIVRKWRGSISFTSVPGDTRFQVRIPIYQSQ
jgi:signal transduction histidine kinase